MRASMTCLSLVAAAFAVAVPSYAFNAYPSELHIGRQDDVERLIVVGEREDGVTMDLTTTVTVRFDPEGIARRDENGRVHAVADGQTTMYLKHGEEEIAVPVTVANAAVTPPISFTNDVEPVLMKAGCNTGSCHGSARGKNGFQLSLFGYDPPNDYTRLTREIRGRRLNTGVPDESLMLLKPLGKVIHEGGTVIEEDSLPYAMLLRWIDEGAKNDPPDPPKLTGVEILPKEVVLDGEGTQQRLVVRALYSDGSDRDVTDLSVLSSSDDLVVTMDGQGVATAKGRGEAYLMARFGSFAVVSQVIALPAGLQMEWPGVTPYNYIDEMIFTKLKKLRIPPAELCSDEVFVRRAYIDILGVLPTVEESHAFFESPSENKRAELVDQLLQRPEFAKVWAMKWADLLRMRSTANILDRKALHRYNDWLSHAISTNKPLDELVTELLTSQGGNFASPAVNFYVAERDTLKMSENVAQVFMGIQIMCAQCHNHPFERWTMEDYYSFAAFFSQVGQKGSDDPRERIIFDSRGGEVKNAKNGQVMAPKFLGGATPDVKGKDRRAVLAEWLTSPENPWFAQTLVNRAWQHFFGKGITDPPDDVRVTNPPSHPILLDEMARRLTEQKYDLRTLVRDICTSYTYQMATQPRDPVIKDDRNFSHALVRRLPAEQLLDAISQVTQTKVKFPNLPLGASATAVADGPSGNRFLTLFGRPVRDTVCVCERRGEPTLAQALHLINGGTVQSALQAADGRVGRLATADPFVPDPVIDEIWIAAFSRPPTDDERAEMATYLASVEDKRAALEDVMWSVVNSKEFIFNH